MDACFALNMEVPLGTSVKTRLVSLKSWHDFRMIAIYSPIMQQAIQDRRTAELPFWAQAAPKQQILVTAIEVMPSTNEQACVRMVRSFSWEGD